MKNIIMTIAVCLFGQAISFAQKIKTADVPAAVQSAFKAKFPKATGIKWEKENASEFEAEFKLMKAECSAKFDASGAWMETETEIKKSALPASVTKYISQNYTGYQIEEAEKVEHHQKGSFFEVEVKKGKTELELLFDKDGKFLEEKKEMEEGKKED